MRHSYVAFSLISIGLTCLIERSLAFNTMALPMVRRDGKLHRRLIPRVAPRWRFAHVPPVTLSVGGVQTWCMSSQGDDYATDGVSTKQTLPSINMDHSSYDWKKVWYPIQFAHNIENDAEPTPITIFDLELVLFRDQTGSIVCLRDLCPHRAAKLSTGQVTDGKLECLYHGWQFSGDGVCVKIPQLANGGTIPKAACVRDYPVSVRENIVYIFLGSHTEAMSVPVPVSKDDLDADKGFDCYEFVVDLPYDHSYLVENLVDPAHIPISHDATPGGGKKENACPYVMEMFESDATGIRGRFKEDKAGKDTWTYLSVDAPGIVRYRTHNEEKGVTFGAALHCIPTGQGKSRLMFKTYFKGLPSMVKVILGLKPMWFRHLNSCTILEQDIGLITSQEDHVRSASSQLKDSFLPLRTSDTFVVEYRKWLDLVGKGMPHYVGWTSSKLDESKTINSPTLSVLKGAQHRSMTSRFFRAVVHNKVTRDALAKFRWCRAASQRLGSLSLAAFCLLTARAASISPASTVSAALQVAPAAPLLAAVCLGIVFLAAERVLGRVENMFYENYERHPRGWKAGLARAGRSYKGKGVARHASE